MWRATATCLLLLVSCDSSAGERSGADNGTSGTSLTPPAASVTDDGSDTADPEQPKASEKPPTTEALAPNTSEGAPAGLAGCLNRQLYTGGTHRFIAEYKLTLSDNMTGEISSLRRKVDATYSFQSGKPNDALFEVQTPEGLPLTEFRLSGSTISFLGTFDSARGFVVNPQPSQSFFDLKDGESRRSVQSVWRHGVDSETGEPVFDDTDFDQIYVGREDVEVAGEIFKACRVEFKAVDVAPFFRSSTVWYAVGSGVALRTVGEEVDPGHPDGLLTLRSTDELLSGTIDGRPIKP